MNKPLANSPQMQGSVEPQYDPQRASAHSDVQLGQPQTPSAAPVDTNNNLDFIYTDRREDEYAQAQRHTKKVNFLKFALPASGGLIILGIIVALVFNSLGSASIELESLSMDDGKLVMESPKLNGFDKNNRPFKLSADQAIQDVGNTSRVELKQILANLPMDDKVSANIQSALGIYDSEQKTLVLEEQVNVETTSGLKLQLQNANVDMDKGTLKASNGVVANSKDADISSNSLSVSDNGNKIVFTGNVRMTLRPKKSSKAKETIQ